MRREVAGSVQHPSGRRGFTLVEVIASTVILAVCIIGMAIASQTITRLKTEARNDVFLTTHNLNVMERLRQMTFDLQPGEELLAYYASDTFGTSEINTDVYIDTSTLGQFRVYDVRIESRMIGYVQMLTSKYAFTNMGGYKSIESMEPGGGYTPPDDEGDGFTPPEEEGGGDGG